MAIRPVFISDARCPWPVHTEHIQFQWFPGLSLTQKQKSIASLHKAACELPGVSRVLEISSKSTDPLGVALSAFNLSLVLPERRRVSVECAFQGSKVFERGGPFVDLLDAFPLDAKRDARLKESGPLTGFRFLDIDWSLEPRTSFYDWLYMGALKAREDLVVHLVKWQAFTDIEFNPERSLNCQAHSVALFVALHQSKILGDVMSSKESFLNFLMEKSAATDGVNLEAQGVLF